MEEIKTKYWEAISGLDPLKLPRPPKPADEPKKPEEKKADDYCAVCTMAMETLYQILDNKDNEDEVKNALESLCR